MEPRENEREREKGREAGAEAEALDKLVVVSSFLSSQLQRDVVGWKIEMGEFDRGRWGKADEEGGQSLTSVGDDDVRDHERRQYGSGAETKNKHHTNLQPALLAQQQVSSEPPFIYRQICRVFPPKLAKIRLHIAPAALFHRQFHCDSITVPRRQTVCPTAPP